MPQEEYAQALVGRTIADGRYELRDVIGSGGMGHVFRAYQAAVEREVAIKIVHPRLMLDPNLTTRFHHEAKNLAKLRNPHCVTIHDFGETDEGLLYLVMEMLSGHSLRAELNAAGPLAKDKVIAYVEQISRGLSAAHKLGMVHRDLKPANINIEISDNGSPLLKVLDFGLSKIVMGEDSEEQITLTKTGQVFGTPQYMSPEQCQGRRLDNRSDIYSLGLIAFEALTGARVYEGSSVVELLIAHTNVPPPKLWELRPDLPDHVIDSIYKAIAKKPNDRWHSVEDFLSGLKGEITNSIDNRSALVESIAIQNVEIADTRPMASVAMNSEAVSRPNSNVNAWLLRLAAFALGIIIAIIFLDFDSPFSLGAQTCDSSPTPAYSKHGTACINDSVLSAWSFDQKLTSDSGPNIPAFTVNKGDKAENWNYQYVPGIDEQAILFEGEDTPDLVMNRSLPLGDRFTIETWLKPSLEPLNLCWQFVFGTLSTGASRACDVSRLYAGWGLMLKRNSDETFDVGFHVARKDKDGERDAVVYRGANPITSKKWNHIAIIADGQSINILVNGTPQTHSVPLRVINEQARYFQFGGLPGRVDGNFHGEIDTTRILADSIDVEVIQDMLSQKDIR